MDAQEMKDRHTKVLKEVVLKGNWALYDEMVDENIVYHSEPAYSGAENMKKMIGTWRTGFPDLDGAIDDQVVEGDICVSRFHLKGTHTGQFGNYAPTNRKFEVRLISIIRFEDGKIVEEWEEIDQLGMLRQLGLID